MTQLARNKKKVVILGGGFAGVECARQLESEFGNEHLWILGMVDLEKCLSFKNSNF